MKTQLITSAIVGCLLLLTSLPNAEGETTIAAEDTTTTSPEGSTAESATNEPGSESGNENQSTEAPTSEPEAEPEATSEAPSQSESESEREGSDDSTTQAAGVAEGGEATTQSSSGSGNAEPDPATTAEPQSEESSSNTTQQTPVTPVQCYDCENCAVAGNVTCTSNNGICNMVINSVTGKVTRLCEANVTSCDSPHPLGLTRMNDCGYCCKGAQCNNLTLSRATCLAEVTKNDENNADNLRMSTCVTIGLIILGVFTRFSLS